MEKGDGLVAKKTFSYWISPTKYSEKMGQVLGKERKIQNLINMYQELQEKEESENSVATKARK